MINKIKKFWLNNKKSVKKKRELQKKFPTKKEFTQTLTEMIYKKRSKLI
jgi:hypothetical protein